MKDGIFLNVFKSLSYWKNINLYGYRCMDFYREPSKDIDGSYFIQNVYA